MPFHLVAQGGRVCVREHDLIDVDMGKLVARFRAPAKDVRPSGRREVLSCHPGCDTGH
jgi:hypothetical protein